MNQQMMNNNDRCGRVEKLLAAYVDAATSARDTWEVEKHLASCPECSHLAEEMRATVNLLRHAPQLDTSDDFMARLHARLDEAGPVPARRSASGVLRDMYELLHGQMQVRRNSMLGIGLAGAVCVAALLVVRPLNPMVGGQANAPEPVSVEALDRHVAVTASSPFDDPVAAKLEAESAGEVAAKTGVD